MNQEEQSYLDLLKNIIDNGNTRGDRTGVGTRSIFGSTLRFSLKNNTIPLLTTKKVFIKGVIEELLFFIRGETDTKKLEANGVNIWKGNTSREFLDNRGLAHYNEGEMGPMYGNVWRSFNGVDQLSNALDLIKNDPNSRRIMVSAYNPANSSLCVLEPCHLFFQFYVNNGKLSCQWMQRAVDCGLGLPFNIASYATLTHLMAKAANIEADELIFVGGDTHVYENHIEPLKEQLKREPSDFPTLKINKEISSIKDMENLNYNDFIIENYNPQSTIKMKMSI